MIAKGHYDDAAIVALLESPEAAARDTHLQSCETCAESFASYREVLGVLDDPSVWDHRPVADIPSIATITSLRSFADTAAAEDAAADTFLTDLLATPREWWRTKLDQHPEHHTAGLVRRLISAASAAIDTMPPNAVEMTALATELADALPPTRYPSDTVLKLRGSAWRERAYALFYTGDLSAAAAAVSTSESHFCDCLVAEYELARVGIVRALVAHATDRLDEASVAVCGSAATFLRAGDTERFVSSRIMDAHVQINAGKYQAALQTLAVLESCEVAPDTRARVVATVAVCYRELGRLTEAIQHYQTAAWLFESIDNKPETVRIRLNVAMVLARAGRLTESQRLFEQVIPEFDELAMFETAAFANIGLAEVLLAHDDYAQVETSCRSAVAYFERANLLYVERARVALAYLEEAVQHRRITPAMIRHVRGYVERLPQQPELLFLPLPE